MNTNINDLSFDALVPSESKYLRKEDVGEDGVVLTVKGFKRVQLEDNDGAMEEKIALCFMEDNYKPMIVNKTNSGLIANATGAKTAGDAIGKQIVVFSDPSVGFGGKITGGLRVKKFSNAQPRQPNVPHSENIEDMKSDLPF